MDNTNNLREPQIRNYKEYALETINVPLNLTTYAIIFEPED